jgi:hypothetical protein
MTPVISHLTDAELSAVTIAPVTAVPQQSILPLPSAAYNILTDRMTTVQIDLVGPMPKPLVLGPVERFMIPRTKAQARRYQLQHHLPRRLRRRAP